MKSAKTFLDDHRVGHGQPFTHTTKARPEWGPGTYYIDNGDVVSFNIHYCNMIAKKEYPSITEKPGPYTYLRVDIDFSFPMSHSKRRVYTERHVKRIISMYQTGIKEMIDENCIDPKILYSVVLEKEAPRIENDRIKDGLHILFPFFICRQWTQDTYLRNRVIEQMKNEDMWKDTGMTNKVENIIDSDIFYKPWMMYGSMNYKGIGSTPYLYTRRRGKGYGHLYNHKLEEISLDEMFEEEMIGRTNSARYYLPIFLSVRECGEETPLKPELLADAYNATTKKTMRKKRHIVKKRSQHEVLEDIKVIKDGHLMDMLSLERADVYEKWIDVGWTLFCISEGHEEALKLWIEFSQRSDKYKPGECEERWDNMEVRGKTMGSLRKMAKDDSPDLYKNWMKYNVDNFIKLACYEPRPTEYDISMIVVSMYKDRFVCADASSKEGLWFEFRDHRWHKMGGQISLKKLIVEDVRYAINCYKFEMAKKQTEKDMEESQRAFYVSQEKKCIAIITALKTDTFQRKVVAQCAMQMYDEDFIKKIDQNKRLLCCEDGVLDLEQKIFREGRPDDYCTLSTGIFYSGSPDFSNKREIKDMFKKMFINKNRRKYCKYLIASCLEGGNNDKIYAVFTGGGGNGKSILFALMEVTFGEYMGKFSRELLIQGRGNSSAGARPDLETCRGRRVMATQEIAENEIINIGVLKELTGNDSFYSRGLWKEGKSIDPQFVLMVQCNDPPKIPYDDDATWTRTRVIDCETKFVLDRELERYPVPVDIREQYKLKRFHADITFKQRLPELARSFLHMLFDIYLKYKKTGLKEPDEVKLATDNYKKDNDPFAEFIGDTIRKEDDKDLAKECFIRNADLYSQFKDWYKTNYPSYSRSIPTNLEFTKLLRKKTGRKGDPDPIYGYSTRDKKLYGYKQFDGDDDEYLSKV